VNKSYSSVFVVSFALLIIRLELSKRIPQKLDIKSGKLSQKTEDKLDTSQLLRSIRLTYVIVFHPAKLRIRSRSKTFKYLLSVSPFIYRTRFMKRFIILRVHNMNVVLYHPFRVEQLPPNKVGNCQHSCQQQWATAY